jgi:hypothetical protein
MRTTLGFVLIALTFILSACSTVSLVKPIKMKLDDHEVAKYAQDIRDFKPGGDSKEFAGGIVVCAKLEAPAREIDNELVYQVRVENAIFDGLGSGAIVPNEFTLFSPTIANGGIELHPQKKYKLFAVMMPDKRLATWNGGVVEVLTCS